MRAGLIASIGGHLAILLWGVIAFPDARPFDVPPVDSLPVDLVPISELTKLRKGEKTAELREEEAPKPTEKKVAEVKPDEKPGEAKKEQPTPQVREAKAEPVKEQAQPEPTPAPKAPEPPAPKAAEPAPAPPEPAPTPVKAPEPAPQKPAEPTKVAEAPQPVKVTPRSKPTPPRPQKTAEAKEQKKDFNPNQIAALLNKVDPSGGGTQASSEPASLGSAKGQSNVQMSQSELDALRGQIARCWNPPVGAAGADDLNVRVKVFLTPGGDVDQQPEVLNTSGNPSFRIASESAKRAVLRCAPYALPVAKYDAWKEVIINFDPRELLGG